MVRLGDMIKAKREQLGLSLREFAERCNLSHSYIKNLEDGDPRTGKDIVPTFCSVEKLAPVFDMTVEDMLKEIGYIQNDEKVMNRPSNKRGYNYTPPAESVLSIREDLRQFVLNPENEEYIRLAKELREKNIKVKFIRDALFER